MLLLGKLALGFTGTVVLAGAYTFRQGTIRVDVDENRDGGSHIHFWVPAAAVPMAVRVVPARHFHGQPAELREWLPTIHAAAKQLEKYDNVVFVEVVDSEDHVKVSTQHGKIVVDVVSPGEEVHVACPVETIDDVVDQLARKDSAGAA